MTSPESGADPRTDAAPDAPATPDAASSFTEEATTEPAGPPVAPELPLEAPLESDQVAEAIPAATPLDDAAPPAAPAVAAPPRFIVTAPAVTLALLVAGVFFMFLLIEPSPRWVVLFGAAVSALALDGVVRAARREAFAEGGLDATPLLLVPALAVLVTPVFLEHNVRGYWALPAGFLAALGYGLLVVTTVSSVREHDPGRTFGRFVAAAATYFIAFALFSLVYTFEVGQQAGALAVGLTALILSVELLREGEVDPTETLLYAVVTGVVLAEVRWTLHYLPIEGYLAGLTLLIAFYLLTGLLHSHVTRQLDRLVVIEYLGIAAAALALIVGARASGLA